MFKNKTILLTGGTGSFGHAMTVALLKLNPKKILIFSRDEFKQYTMQNSFKKYISKLRFFIGDVRDSKRLNMAMKNVDFVIHAAALKQVDSAEYNPFEFIKTNINGAQNVIESCLMNNVKKVIALSTDKAVNPINLYGATKLASDKLFVSSNNLVGSNDTKFSVVRYGNVLGSRGSVMPLFYDYLRKKKNYFPITNSKTTRFWITLETGVDFVLNSFKIMNGGEIFIPKMPSVRTVDLAKSINPKYKLKIVGLRPGEKIHETLFSKEDCEYTLETKNSYIIEPTIKKYFNYQQPKKIKFKRVKENFSYNSHDNNFLTIKEIKELNKKILLIN
tara:strand:- start:925 stop:1920 length:996 start_codon:yes stop_codon:yes gene_type:complete